jgi:primosomal protein N'
VAFESAADTEFDYFVPDDIWPVEEGQRVEVPFGRKNKFEAGFCTQSDVRPEDSFISRRIG